MHLCLEIDEIVVAICAFLDSKALYSLALTCTYFKEPALRALWKELPSLLPLFQLFPTVSVEFKDSVNLPWEKRNHRTYITLKGPVASTDWSSIASYAPYVLKLNGFFHGVSSNALNSAALAFEGTHVFPRLQRLFLGGTVDESIPFAKILLSPSLTHVIISGIKGGKDATAMLSELGIACPLMVSFSCTAHLDNARMVFSALCDILSQTVLCWNELEQINAPMLTVDAINHLSHLPSFQHLTLESGFHPDSTVFSEGFSSLQSLRISNVPLDSIIKLMRASQSCVLERTWVSLPARDEVVVAQWKDFFYILALRSSTARTSHLTTVGYKTYMTEADALRPLLAAGNLTALDLPNCHFPNLDDAFIEELAKASPKLTRLELGTSCVTNNPPTLTLKSYIHVFQHCPKLSFLGLVADMSTAYEWIGKKPGEGQIELRGRDFELNVGDSEAVNPKEVAAFLSAFFYEPMDTLGTADHVDEEINEGWNQVENLLPIFIHVRMQERQLR